MEEGFSNVAVLSSHLIPGEEYDKLRALIEEYRPRFPSLSLTAPLLHTTGDLLAVAKAVLDRHPVAEGEALVLMGHGTYHPANSIYPALDFVFRTLAGRMSLWARWRATRRWIRCCGGCKGPGTPKPSLFR